MPLDEAIRTAAAEVRKAAEMVVRSFREDAAERLKRLRDSPTGDLVGDLLKLVEKYPGQGVLVAILVGFFLGRTFRK
jgi:vacuolar-type H+-ATPase subunit E/Vma4